MGNLRVSPAASVAVGAAGSVLTARRCGGSGFVVMVTGAGDAAPFATQPSNAVADGAPPSAGIGTTRSDAAPATAAEVIVGMAVRYRLTPSRITPRMDETETWPTEVLRTCRPPV